MPLREVFVRAGFPVAVALVGGVLWLWGPWSPLAMDRANARFAGGDVAGAIDGYEAVAEGWHTPSTRAEAWRRAGMLRRGLGDARGAVRAFEAAADLAPEASERAEVLVELALLYKASMNDPKSCAEAFEQAALESASGSEDLAASGCWVEAGETKRALEALARAAARPGTAEAAEEAIAGLNGVLGAVADGDE